MANTTKKPETTKEFKLTPEFSLWKSTTKNENKPYFTGKTEKGEKLVGFYNTKKKNPKEPDLRVYFKTTDGLDKDCGYSIWHNVNEKTGKEYFSGVYYEGNDVTYKIVGFKSKSKNEKAPALNFFLREVTEGKPKNVFEEQVEQNKGSDESDELPFFI